MEYTCCFVSVKKECLLLTHILQASIFTELGQIAIFHISLTCLMVVITVSYIFIVRSGYLALKKITSSAKERLLTEQYGVMYNVCKMGVQRVRS